MNMLINLLKKMITLLNEANEVVSLIFIRMSNCKNIIQYDKTINNIFLKKDHLLIEKVYIISPRQ